MHSSPAMREQQGSSQHVHHKHICRFHCRLGPGWVSRNIATSNRKHIRPHASAASAEEVTYTTSQTDKAFIAMCRKAYGRIANFQSSRDWNDGDETYKGMVEVSRAMMQGRSAEEQRDAVISGFPKVPAWFRRAFPYSRWGAELNARITPAFFTWLVGPMETVEAAADSGEVQRSGVHIKRCRYLAESRCVGMCVNLCKAPVQTFFTDELGMPLTMKPNFEDYSCEMGFGLTPPRLEDDEVMRTACLAECSTGKGAGQAVCHKLL